MLCFFFFLMMLRTPVSTLFPYTTLFRSAEPAGLAGEQDLGHRHAAGQALLRAAEHQRDAVGAGEAEQPSGRGGAGERQRDRKSTRLNSSHMSNSYAVFCLKKKINIKSTR